MAHSDMEIVISQAVEDVAAQKQIVTRLATSGIMVDGVHYMKIGSSNKPTLTKAGAEMILRAAAARPQYYVMESLTRQQWETDEFSYTFGCNIIHIPTGTVIGDGIGNCNSSEDKYGYRWVPLNEVPSGYDIERLVKRSAKLFEFEFAYKKRETSGKYGKPESYWEQFDTAIATSNYQIVSRKTKNGESTGYEIDATMYRIQNPDVRSLLNTLMKMAQKRAMVAAALTVGNASQFFTQDLEDLGRVIDENDVPAPLADPNEWNQATQAAWYTNRVGAAAFGRPTKEQMLAALNVEKLGDFKGGAWAEADAALLKHMNVTDIEF